MAEKKGRLWPWYLLAAALVAADQVVKILVRQTMEVGDQRPCIPYVLELFYVRNTGAAFSLFANHTWALALVSGVISLALGFVLSRRRWLVNWLGRLGVSLILAGAVGNFIDRAFFGAVTDMFNFTFMTFGIFNVADICVVVGAVVCIFYLLFQGKKEDGDGTDPADSTL